MKRELPMLVAGLTGLFMLSEYYLNIPAFRARATELQNWAIIIAAFALCLAAASLIRNHAKKVADQKPEWFNSVLLLVAMAVTVISGISSNQSPVFRFIFDRMLTPLGAAFYAMVAYYLFSAAYRTFRARSGEATALLLAGVLVMLGRAPIGEVIWRQFPVIAEWIVKWPNTAGSRGVLIGAAVGTVGAGMRVIFGVDRTYLGGDE